MKRKAEDTMGGGYGASGEKSVAKKERLRPSDVDIPLSEDQLAQAMTLVSDIVTDRVQNLFAESSEVSGDVSLAFFGQSRDFIEGELFSGGEFVFGTPDGMNVESPAQSEDELAVAESDDEDEVLKDPEAYAWDLAAEFCDEILDEIVDEELSGWQDDAERAEVMTEIASLRDEIRSAAYQAIWEELEESQ